MSSVLSETNCPQCNYTHADEDFNCRSGEWWLSCRCCGYHEATEAIVDDAGKIIDWKHRKEPGAGALFYKSPGAIAYRTSYLAQEEEVIAAKEWLEKRLKEGTVESDTAYLTSWNEETKTAETVVGTFFEWEQLDDECLSTRHRVGTPKPRPVIVEYRRRLSYTCQHVAVATILLLEGQRIPVDSTVLHANQPCPACFPKFREALQIKDRWSYQSLEVVPEQQEDDRVWKNRFIDGTSPYVVLAESHARQLKSPAATFYAANPDREFYHPDCMGFQVQLEGWSDEEIRDKRWLAKEGE